MNTPAHILIGAAAFGRPRQRRVLIAAMAGGLMPDLSLYLLAGSSLFILNIPPQTVFGELYFSDTWQTIFAIDNSVFVWGLLLAIALWRKGPALLAFAGAGLIHLALDFPLHAGDGRAHFWPLSRWVFDSPLSYWDRNHHAAVIIPIGIVLCLCALIILLRRRFGVVPSAIFALLFAAEIWVARQWLLFF